MGRADIYQELLRMEQEGKRLALDDIFARLGTGAEGGDGHHDAHEPEPLFLPVGGVVDVCQGFGPR
jgi:hypothetical protein